MRRSLNLLPALCVAVAPLAPVHAESATLTCPVAELRIEATTSIPDPWWNTPYIGTLVSAEVVVVRNEQVLVCNYGGGTVQRKAPANSTCRAENNTFQCE
jgi:hypothetical protein